MPAWGETDQQRSAEQCTRTARVAVGHDSYSRDATTLNGWQRQPMPMHAEESGGVQLLTNNLSPRLIRKAAARPTRVQAAILSAMATQLGGDGGFRPVSRIISASLSSTSDASSGVARLLTTGSSTVWLRVRAAAPAASACS
eukprot:CAMPEP_0185301468 /NCGR_PEP_ID=MMETSP1363-20130426/12764_1 /TAXON_ID=38817 /ORGANISM="Gephyrocapsa oceanica, Strain RCC1303" /LENGTH=141 /DNA_ID=CAMNT_0027898495 /DNA_START=85 /DNA_END=509 /DNA_ORIENTATION=-